MEITHLDSGSTDRPERLDDDGVPVTRRLRSSAGCAYDGRHVGEVCPSPASAVFEGYAGYLKRWAAIQHVDLDEGPLGVSGSYAPHLDAADSGPELHAADSGQELQGGALTRARSLDLDVAPGIADHRVVAKQIRDETSEDRAAGFQPAAALLGRPFSASSTEALSAERVVDSWCRSQDSGLADPLRQTRPASTTVHGGRDNRQRTRSRCIE